MGTDSLVLHAADTLKQVNEIPGQISFPWLIFKMIAMLILVIGLIIAISWVFKKYTNVFSSEINSDWIQVLNKVQIAPQKTIYLIKIFTKIIAVMETPNHTTVLSQWNEDEVNYVPPEKLMGNNEGFLKVLKKSLKK